MIKGSIQEEDITVINIYAPNIGALQYVRQMLTSMNGEINSNTTIVGPEVFLVIICWMISETDSVWYGCFPCVWPLNACL